MSDTNIPTEAISEASHKAPNAGEAYCPATGSEGRAAPPSFPADGSRASTAAVNRRLMAIRSASRIGANPR